MVSHPVMQIHLIATNLCDETEPPYIKFEGKNDTGATIFKTYMSDISIEEWEMLIDPTMYPARVTYGAEHGWQSITVYNAITEFESGDDISMCVIFDTVYCLDAFREAVRITRKYEVLNSLDDN